MLARAGFVEAPGLQVGEGQVISFAEDVHDAIRDAVILDVECRSDGVRVFLKDGRTLLFPGADMVLICASRYLLQ
jgi:hypothetical protein